MIDQLAPGSAPKLVGQEVRGLRGLGHSSDAIVLKRGYDQTYRYHLDGIFPRCLTDGFPFALSKLDFRIPGFSFLSLRHLLAPGLVPALVRRTEWDMIVCHTAYACLSARQLAKYRKIPYLAFIGTEPAWYLIPRIYSENWLGRLSRFIMPLAIEVDRLSVDHCRAIITYSKRYHHLIEAYTDKPIEVLPPGCFPIAKPRQQKESFVLAFDRWDAGNTPNPLLEIIKNVSPEIMLVIAGHWYPPALKALFLQQLQKTRLASRVTLLGPITEDDIQELCSRALAYVHTNREAFGMQALEAAGAGCPFIIPAGSGVTDLFQDGRHGYFPKENDLQDFSTQVERLSENRKLAMSMGEEAWKVACQYTWERHARGLEQIIRKYGI